MVLCSMSGLRTSIQARQRLLRFILTRYRYRLAGKPEWIPYDLLATDVVSTSDSRRSPDG